MHEWVPYELWKERRSGSETVPFDSEDYSTCWMRIYSKDCYASLLLSLANASSPAFSAKIIEGW